MIRLYPTKAFRQQSQRWSRSTRRQVDALGSGEESRAATNL